MIAGHPQLSVLRKFTQGAFLLFCLFMGYRFYNFFLWATTGADYTPRPPSVEAFLPIASLMSLKQLILTGIYDPIHPAGLTIFLAALTLAFLFHKGFCGWICPVGTFSEHCHAGGAWLLSIARKSRKKTNWFPPRLVDYPLLSVKYLLLLFFSYLIVWKMDLATLQRFAHSPYSFSADARMLLFFLQPSRLAITFLAALFLVSLFWRNFWCRYLCPYGALLGLIATLSPMSVRRDPASCIDCKKCEINCPGSIKLTDKQIIRTPECIGCLECVATCPQQDCLTLAVLPIKKPLSPYILPVCLLAVFFTFWISAVLTGHWHSAVPDTAFQNYYKIVVK